MMSFQAGSAAGRSECTFSEHWKDSALIIGCVGVIDMLTAPELQRHIANALAKSPESLIVDLTGVSFLASHGMNTLIAGLYQCTAATEFAVVADGPVTRRPMQLIGITDILNVHATVGDALSSSAMRPV